MNRHQRHHPSSSPPFPPLHSRTCPSEMIGRSALTAGLMSATMVKLLEPPPGKKDETLSPKRASETPATLELEGCAKPTPVLLPAGWGRGVQEGMRRENRALRSQPSARFSELQQHPRTAPLLLSAPSAPVFPHLEPRSSTRMVTIARRK